MTTRLTHLAMHFATIGLLLGTISAVEPAAKAKASVAVSNSLVQFLARWDDLNNRVLFYRNQKDPSDAVAVEVTDNQGNVGQSVNILKDFPGAHSATVADVAGGPAGSFVMACRLEYDVRPLKELLLTYDQSGTLHNVIDTAPYEAGPLAVDTEGNIYILAAKFDVPANNSGPTYPTVIKYDSNGNLLASMLPSSNFPGPKGSYPTDWSDHMGGPLLRVTTVGIAVFAPSSGYLVLLSQQGQRLARHYIGDIRQQVATQYRFSRAYTSFSFLDPNGDLVFKVRLSDLPGKARLQDPLVKIDSASLSAGKIKLTELNPNVGQDGGRLVGIDGNGRGVYLYSEVGKASQIVRK